jgi:hypothetical protein
MRKSQVIALLPMLSACSSAPDQAPVTGSDPGAPPAAPTAATAQPTAGVPQVTGLHLQSLVASSGEGVERVLDGDPTTGWSPAHDPIDEGILLRFEEPTRVMQAQIQLCPESSAATFQSFVNGNENTLVRVNAGGPVLIPWRELADSPAIKSLYLRVLGSDGPVDVCEVYVTLPPERAMKVRPPRTVPATLQASSTLEPCDAYHAGYLLDGRTDFGWVEGADGLGVGEHLTIGFEAPLTITGLDLWNGYQRSEQHFTANARLAKLELAVDGGAPVALAVADTQGPQRLELPAPVTGKAFVFTVTEAVSGSKYEDLVISELRLRDASGPFSLRTDDLAEREHELLEQIDGSGLERVVDRSWRGLCNEGVRLTLRSNHSFVSYAQRDDGPDDDLREVFDGAWVVQALGTPDSIRTFGRKHRTQTTWVPYGNDQVQSTVRIAGGKSELWLHDSTSPARAAALLEDQAFAAEHAYCMDAGTAWLETDMGDLLFIQGASLAGIYQPF